MTSIGDKVAINGTTGTVKYVGATKFAEGTWYGIELDDCVGKNDGSVQGVRYFTLSKTQGNYGLFTQLENLRKMDENDNLRLENAKLVRVVEALQKKTRQLHLECEQLNVSLDSFESQNLQISALQETIEEMTLNGVDWESKYLQLSQHITQVQKENEELKLELNPLKEEVALRRKIEHVGLSDEKLVDNSVLLQKYLLLEEVLSKLEQSLKDVTERYEDLLEENTILLEENTTFQADISRLNNELEIAKQSLVDLTLQLEAQEGSSNIVDFLTENNVKLSNSLDALNEELNELKRKDEMHTTMNKIYVDIENELSDQLRELQESYDKSKIVQENSHIIKVIGKTSNQDLSKRDEELKSLRAKLQNIEHISSESVFLKDLYDTVFNNDEKKVDLLQIQVLFLSKIITNERMAISADVKITCEHFLLVLHEVIKEIMRGRHSEISELLLESFGDTSAWKYSLIKGRVPANTANMPSIIQFLKTDQNLDSNLTLMMNVLSVTFGVVMPNILAHFQKRLTSQQHQEQISEMYALSLSIEKYSGEIINQIAVGNEWLEHTSHNLFTSDLLENIFQEVVSKVAYAERELNLDFDHILTTLNVISNNLRSIQNCKPSESMSSESTNDHKAGPSKEPLTTNISVDIAAAEYKKDVGILETAIAEKHSYIEELLVTVQVLQNKLLEANDSGEELKTLSIKLNEIRTENSHLLSSASQSNAHILDLEEKLMVERLKAYQIVPNPTWHEAVSEFEFVERLDLISEIKDLRQTLSKYTWEEEKTNLDHDWLNDAFTEILPSAAETQFRRELHGVGRDLSDFLKFSNIISLNRNKTTKSANKSKNTERNYLSNAKYKRSLIELKVQNICIKDIITL